MMRRLSHFQQSAKKLQYHDQCVRQVDARMPQRMSSDHAASLLFSFDVWREAGEAA